MWFANERRNFLFERETRLSGLQLLLQGRMLVPLTAGDCR